MALWIKEELYMDFKLNECRDIKSIIETIKNYIKYYNNELKGRKKYGKNKTNR